MLEPAHSPHRDQAHSAERRSLLSLLAVGTLAAPALLLAGCANAIPPREYRKPPSHITGRGGNSGKGGN
jgi:hypothetical protein